MRSNGMNAGFSKKDKENSMTTMRLLYELMLSILMGGVAEWSKALRSGRSRVLTSRVRIASPPQIFFLLKISRNVTSLFRGFILNLISNKKKIFS